MKLTTAPTKIRGLLLGEATLNLIRMNEIPIKAKFALVDEEGNACGYFEKSNGWSEKTFEALQKLVGAMETDAHGVLFVDNEEAPTASPEFSDEPPQF